MLLASAMGVSAEKVEAIVGDLKYEIDTETKEASVIKGDYSGLYFVTIPEKIAVEGVNYAVTSVGDKAFYNLSNLTSVTLPNSVKTIGESSFHLCIHNFIEKKRTIMGVNTYTVYVMADRTSSQNKNEKYKIAIGISKNGKVNALNLSKMFLPE